MSATQGHRDVEACGAGCNEGRRQWPDATFPLADASNLKRPAPGQVPAVQQVEAARARVAEPPAELVLRAKQGDAPAFRELVDRYQRLVYGVAYTMLGDAHEAEDAAQEAFLRLHRSLERYRADAAFGTWLFRIAISAAADQRRRRRVAAPSGDESGHAEPLAIEASPEQRELVRNVLEAMAELPPALRKPLVLREVYGYEYGEIADLLGRPVGTVKAAVHRGRKALREALERLGGLERED